VFLLQCGVGIVLALAMEMIGLAMKWNLSSAGLLYVLLIVTFAVHTGFWQASVISVAAIFCQTHFFAPPVFSFYISTKLLIVDDESAIRQVLSRTLRDLGFEITESARGEEAVSLVRMSAFDAVLLDINMPGMGGVATCRALRKFSTILPILMLTVRDSENDKVEALDAGADDYVTKPFALRELVARVNAAVRRGHAPQPVNSAIAVGELSICSDRRIFMKRGEVIHLTPTQFDIIHLLMRHHGRPVSHRKLLTAIWGVEYRDHVEYLRTYMRQLCKKIEDAPAHPRYLLTEPYVGYRFREEGIVHALSGVAVKSHLEALARDPSHYDDQLDLDGPQYPSRQQEDGSDQLQHASYHHANQPKRQ
jgi:two-component system KDP operon response regulator KdpE